MSDNSTIKIEKNEGKYKVNIICDQNGKIVATGNRRGYAKLTLLYWKLSQILEGKYFCKMRKSSKQWWFTIYESDATTGKVGPIILSSEGYHNQGDCMNGLDAALEAVKAGRVALDFSEDTNIWNLKDLIENPTLGIVQT